MILLLFIGMVIPQLMASLNLNGTTLIGELRYPYCFPFRAREGSCMVITTFEDQGEENYKKIKSEYLWEPSKSKLTYEIPLPSKIYSGHPLLALEAKVNIGFCKLAPAGKHASFKSKITRIEKKTWEIVASKFLGPKLELLSETDECVPTTTSTTTTTTESTSTESTSTPAVTTEPPTTAGETTTVEPVISSTKVTATKPVITATKPITLITKPATSPKKTPVQPTTKLCPVYCHNQCNPAHCTGVCCQFGSGK